MTAEADLSTALKAIEELKGADDPIYQALAAIARASAASSETANTLANTLAKAAAPHPEPDGDEDGDDDDDDGDGDEDDDDSDEDDDEDDDDAGYEDMDKGASFDDDGFVDVTADVAELKKSVADLGDLLQSVSQQLALLGEMQHGLFAHSDAMLKAQAGATIALGKAVVETQSALSRTPAQGITPKFTIPQGGDISAPKDQPNDFGWIGGSEAVQARKLFKAKALGIISAEQHSLFIKDGSFSADPTTNTTLRAAVAAVKA